jgi:hypothetical protein
MSNPFKIIEPAEQAPENVKGELMDSIKNIVLILRFVQLFVADTTAVVLTKMKIDLTRNEDVKSQNDNPEES